MTGKGQEDGWDHLTSLRGPEIALAQLSWLRFSRDRAGWDHQPYMRHWS
jgi:hypothetical protein